MYQNRIYNLNAISDLVTNRMLVNKIQPYKQNNQTKKGICYIYNFLFNFFFLYFSFMVWMLL